MDFHSLSRRELQALCKKNKIPANMTNAAMADALKALQHVEGIEELIQASESKTQQSAEELVIGSPEVPRTACRTTTRRKPVKESESSQPLTRTRGATRRRTKEEFEEEKNDVPATPTMASSRTTAPVASTRRKTEIAKEPIQMGSLAYSTRRSVRLAEKQLAELSLNGRGKTKPIKIDDFSKEMPQDLPVVQENKSLSGAYKQTISEDGSESINDLDSKPNEVLVESAKDSKDDLQDSENTEVVESAKDSKDDLQGSEITEVLESVKYSKDDLQDKEVAEVLESANDSKDDLQEIEVTEDFDDQKEAYLQMKIDVGCEESDECNVSFGEDLEINLLDETKPLEKKGCDDFICDAEKSNEVLEMEVGQNSKIDYHMSLDESSAGKASDVNVTDSYGDISEKIEEESEELVKDSSNDSMGEIKIGEEEAITIDDKKTSPTLVSNDELKGNFPFSKWAVDPLLGQVPRPTHLAPRNSSIKKLTTLRRMNDDILDDDYNNKENNIDGSFYGKLEQDMKEENNEKKDKQNTPLANKSRRQLEKMLKEKLSLKCNVDNNDNENIVQPKQFGKLRPALQALPENNQD